MAAKAKPAKAPKKTKAAKAKQDNKAGPMPHLHRGTGYIKKPE